MSKYTIVFHFSKSTMFLKSTTKNKLQSSHYCILFFTLQSFKVSNVHTFLKRSVKIKNVKYILKFWSAHCLIVFEVYNVFKFQKSTIFWKCSDPDIGKHAVLLGCLWNNFKFQEFKKTCWSCENEIAGWWTLFFPTGGSVPEVLLSGIRSHRIWPPCDLFFWSYIKSEVNSTRPR